jgi:hypothetical protein
VPGLEPQLRGRKSAPRLGLAAGAGAVAAQVRAADTGGGHHLGPKKLSQLLGVDLEENANDAPR